jgi:hypothetical protein
LKEFDEEEMASQLETVSAFVEGAPPGEVGDPHPIIEALIGVWADDEGVVGRCDCR